MLEEWQPFRLEHVPSAFMLLWRAQYFWRCSIETRLVDNFERFHSRINDESCEIVVDVLKDLLLA